MVIRLVEPIVKLDMFLALLSRAVEGSMRHLYGTFRPYDFGCGSEVF
jgi:hypothetical protein